MRDDDVDEHKAPLLDHLIELRNRLMYSVIALGVAFVICYWFSDRIFLFLAQPYTDIVGNQPGRRFIYTALQEPFWNYVKVSFFGAIFLAFPVIGYQLWRFVAPGLYRNERRAFLPYLVASPVLFFLGAAMAYYLIFPLAWRFFLGFEAPAGPGTLAIEVEPRVGDYLPLVMKIIFAFGLCFQIPVALTLLGRAGIVSSAGLGRNRKYAVVIIFVVAAVLTPPDVISQIGLALPALLLYEISILLVRRVERRRSEREAEEDAADSSA